VTPDPTWPATSVDRLAGVPWGALRPFAAALDAPLARVLEGAPAERVLDRFLRERRDLRAEERCAAAEAVFGVGLWRRRLRHHAGAEASGRLLLASLLRDLAGRPDAEALCGLAPGALPAPVPPPRDLAAFYSLPDWLAAVIRREAGEGAAVLADALDRPGPIHLRANRARIDRESLALRLADEGVRTRPGLLAPDALEVTSPRPNLLALASLREGLAEVQDEGSQLLGEAVAAGAGEEVLDLCAGAGGKALQLAAAVGPSGAVHALDPDAERLARLGARAARAGAPWVRLHGPEIPTGLLVDRALVDAPCSELGALRRGPDLRFRIDPGGFAAHPALQLRLLERAAGCLRPGGRLVYATCTFRREENEEVALAFEGRRPDLERVPALPPGLAVARNGEAPRLLGADGFLRSWPHRHGTDGFFAAAWVRRRAGGT